MTRKFINKQDKKGLDSKEAVSAEDEWAHLSEEKESVEKDIKTKIEAADAADVGDRTVTFGNEQQIGIKTIYDSVKQEARNAMDAAGNTGQYIRFVNRHIENQRNQIEKIKKIKEKFDHEIDLLQSNRTKLDSLNKKLTPHQDVKVITESLKELLIEKGITKSKLDNLKNEIDIVEEELEQQEEQIEKVSDEIKNKSTSHGKIEKEDEMKNDLKLLMEKYGISNLSDLEKLMK